MSCGPCDEKRRRDRMSRGEFIGAGAAAAAVASMGPMAAAAQSQEAACDKPPDSACGADASVRWRVPASVLQVLWGDIFPRFVAYRWVHDSFPAPIGGPNPVVTPDMLIQAIHNYIHGLVVDGDATASCKSLGGGNWDCDLSVCELTAFEERAKLVIEHLETGSASTKIPIKFTTSEGFDFLLTDAGIELFSPKPPRDSAELLRYYEYRLPGKGTIGIPGYLDDADALAFDVQSPVSPSQIFIDFPTYAGLGGGPSWGNGCVLEDQEDCLDFEVFGDEDRQAFTDFEGADLPEEPGWIGPVRKITYASYLAAVTKAQCWWLEGSVYRGILEQLPRIVATAWREQVLSCGSSSSYTAMLALPDGLREIFNQRLESTLPPATRMVFALDAAIEDVMVTNRGLLVPDPGTPPVNLDAMLTAIANGRAGNPVFTDSRRPPRM